MFFKINIANIFELFIIIYEKQRQINEFIFVVWRLPRFDFVKSRNDTGFIYCASGSWLPENRLRLWFRFRLMHAQCSRLFLPVVRLWVF